MEPIRVLLADDHALFRKGVRTLLEQNAGHRGCWRGGQRPGGGRLRPRELIPDAVLMGIKMPVLSGIEATQAILKENPHIGVVLVTMFDDPESVFSGMRAGARGYVLKEAEPEELRIAIESAHRGEFILCPIIAGRVLDHFRNDTKPSSPELPYEQLSQRELQVLQLAANGLSNKLIGAELVISEKTVRNHTANIFSKLQVNDRTQAILYALRKGLITMPEDPARTDD